MYHSEAFGYDAEGAKELWDESIQVIASMFVDDPFPGWKGAHYNLPQRDLVPKPIQKPHPPMWLAATQPGHVRQGGSDGSWHTGIQRH